MIFFCGVAGIGGSAAATTSRLTVARLAGANYISTLAVGSCYVVDIDGAELLQGFAQVGVYVRNDSVVFQLHQVLS